MNKWFSCDVSIGKRGITENCVGLGRWVICSEAKHRREGYQHYMKGSLCKKVDF